MFLLTTVPLTATTVPSGLRAVSSLALALGFMALKTFAAMSTITFILNTAIRDRCHNAEKPGRQSTLPPRRNTSREMKFETDVDTL